MPFAVFLVASLLCGAAAKEKEGGRHDDGDAAAVSGELPDSSICRLQGKLLFGMDAKYSDRWICCAGNTEFAERSGTFLQHLDADRLRKSGQVTFYDARCGVPLFKAPAGRSFDQWWQESVAHGWPSFRTSEVIANNVRVSEVDPASGAREVVSSCGTHLGHNIPDEDGDRFCINLLCISGSEGGALRQDSLTEAEGLPAMYGGWSVVVPCVLLPAICLIFLKRRFAGMYAGGQKEC